MPNVISFDEDDARCLYCEVPLEEHWMLFCSDSHEQLYNYEDCCDEYYD